MAGRFEPKVPVTLAPPKDDPITLEELAAANGKSGEFSRSHRRQFPSHGATPDSSSHRGLTHVAGVDGGKCYVAIKVHYIHDALRCFLLCFLLT